MGIETKEKKGKLHSGIITVLTSIVALALLVYFYICYLEVADEYETVVSSMETERLQLLSQTETERFLSEIGAAETPEFWREWQAQPLASFQAGFAKVQRTLLEAEGSFAFLVDSDYIIVAAIPEEQVGADFQALLQQAAFSESTTRAAFCAELERLGAERNAGDGAAVVKASFRYEKQDYVISASAIGDTQLVLALVTPIEVMKHTSRALFGYVLGLFNAAVMLVFVLVLLLHIIGYYMSSRLSNCVGLLEFERQKLEIAKDFVEGVFWEIDLESNQLQYSSDTALAQRLGQDITTWNREFEEKAHLHPADIETFYYYSDCLYGKDPVVRVELRVKNEQGEYVWNEWVVRKIFRGDVPVFAIGHAVNIHVRKLEQEEQRAKAGRDTLTRLDNQFTFATKAELQFERGMGVCALLIANIDDFSSINQTFGPLFADAILIDFSTRLRKLFDDNSETLLGRLGADEFVVLLSEVSSLGAVEDAARRLQHMVRDIYIGGHEVDYMTCSLGIALFPTDGRTYAELHEHAYQALTHTKKYRRGQFAFFAEEMKREEPTRAADKPQQELPVPHIENRTLVDSDFIANAIDILFDSREINVSINMVLSLIGNKYNLDQLVVIEFAHGGKLCRITHEWGAKSRSETTARVNHVPFMTDELFVPFLECEQGVFSCSDCTQLVTEAETEEETTRWRSIMKKRLGNVRALFQCGISDQGSYIGYISAMTRDKVHSWNKTELDSLTLLSKIIGSYILHLRSQETIDFMSQKDSLTNAYNFQTFCDRVNTRLQEHQDKHYAMLYADIYQFKLINDNYGYQIGDYILTSIAEILSKAGGADSILCRITGDKFALFTEYDNETLVQERVQNILLAIKRIRKTDEEYYKLVIMLGIYMVKPTDSAIVAVDRANIARKNVQNYHRSAYAYFTEDMHNALISQKKIEDSMEEALRGNEFVVYYQPKINMMTTEIIGAEALVRWNKPNVGLIPPGDFIPIFEENGFIVALDYYVLDVVCSHLRRMMDEGRRVYPVAVNFSRIHFDTRSLPQVLQNTLAKYQIPPWLIEVEITESALSATGSYLLGLLKEIHQLGFRLSMDDFGAGLSSLNLLRDLPFDILKIDKEFLHFKAASPRERIVLMNVVRMAIDLNMDIICEGVETAEQVQFLKQIGCFIAQGFYFSKPLPEEEFIERYLSFATSEEAESYRSATSVWDQY